MASAGRQPSRKGRKAWRKNVDVSEVERGLEDVREQQIKGGLVQEKPNKELFTIDVVGDKGITKKERLKKPSKIDEILSARSSVAEVGQKRSPSVTDGLLPQKRQRTRHISSQDLKLLKVLASRDDSNASKAAAKLESQLKGRNPASSDLWDRHEVSDDSNAWVKEKLPVKKPRTLREEPIRLVEDGEAAVPKPKGEYSYNPVEDDWKEALESEGKKEVSKELARRRAAQKRQRMNERVQAIAQRVKNEEDEISGESSETDFSGENSDSLEISSKRNVDPVRKTAAKRRKEERIKKEKEAAEARRLEKARLKELNRFTNVKKTKEIDGDPTDRRVEQPSAEAIRRRKEMIRRSVKYGLQPKSFDLQLPDELPESLRVLKPEGNLLRDRFRRIQERGLVEAREPFEPKKQKHKYKSKTKYSYLDK